MAKTEQEIFRWGTAIAHHHTWMVAQSSAEVSQESKHLLCKARFYV